MIQINLETLVSVGSLICVLIAVYQFRHQRKEAAVREGQQVEKQKQLIADLEKAECRIKMLEDKASSTDIDAAEMKKDIKYLVDTVKEIKIIIDQFAPHTSK